MATPTEEKDAQEATLEFQVTRLEDLEDQVWTLTEALHSLADEVEGNEPLQAKQSMQIIKARILAMEVYVNGLKG